MEAIVLSTLMIVAGGYFGLRNLRFLRSDEALRGYIQSSPKAAAWVTKYGTERAMKMVKETTAPLGIIISVALIGAGLWNLYRVLL